MSSKCSISNIEVLILPLDFLGLSRLSEHEEGQCSGDV